MSNDWFLLLQVVISVMFGLFAGIFIALPVGGLFWGAVLFVIVSVVFFAIFKGFEWVLTLSFG